MISLIHYISASRRLDELERTIILMGGSNFDDENVPMQLAAQREMLRHEVNYYRDKAVKVNTFLLGGFIVFVVSCFVMVKLGVF